MYFSFCFAAFVCCLYISFQDEIFLGKISQSHMSLQTQEILSIHRAVKNSQMIILKTCFIRLLLFF